MAFALRRCTVAAACSLATRRVAPAPLLRAQVTRGSVVAAVSRSVCSRGVSSWSMAPQQEERPAPTMPPRPDLTPRVRRSPFKPDFLLRENTVGQMYSNLVHLASNGQTPRANALNRLVDRVETQEDLEFALDGLALCRTRLVKLDPRTATKLVRAAARAGVPERGIAVLADSIRYRLFPEPNSFHWIAVHVGLLGNAELVQAAYDAMGAAEVALNKRGAEQFIKAFVDAGSLEGALKVYDAAVEAGVAVTAHAVRKLVLGGAPLATSADEVGKLEAAVAAAAISGESGAKLTAALEAARGSVAGEEVEGEGEADGEAEGEAQA